VGVARGHQRSGVVGPTPHGRWMNRVGRTPAPDRVGARRRPVIASGPLLMILLFARCLLVCPGTARQHPTLRGRDPRRSPHGPALTGTESTDLIAEQRLLIRGNIGLVAGFPIAVQITSSCVSVQARPIARNGAHGTALIPQAIYASRPGTSFTAAANRHRGLAIRVQVYGGYTKGTSPVHGRYTTGSGGSGPDRWHREPLRAV